MNLFKLWEFLDGTRSQEEVKEYTVSQSVRPQQIAVYIAEYKGELVQLQSLARKAEIDALCLVIACPSDKRA